MIKKTPQFPSLPSLMHAKFVIADGAAGYFGTANLTSVGLSEHLEMGVALTPRLRRC